MAYLSPSAHGIQLVNFGIAATPIGSVTDGVINNSEAIGEAIHQIVRYYNIKEKRVVCSLPGRSVVIRQVTLPAGLSDKELKVAAIGEVERFLPFPLDEMEYDYQILGDVYQGDVKQTSLLFIAAHRDAVQRRIEAARVAGLESVEIDVEPFVLLRSVVESGMFEDQDTFTQTFLLIEMGAVSTSVSIVKNGILRFTRIFAVGGDTLTHAIESGLSVPFLEAERIKRDRALAFIDELQDDIDRETREIHEMILSHLETLSLEVRRSLAYYTSKYRGEEVTKIVLTGGASMLRGIARYYEEDLGIPVMFGNPLANVPYIGEQELDLVAGKAPFLGIAAGLSLRQVPAKVLGRYCLRVNIEPTYEFGSAAQASMLSTH
jgi:type IV pilus assembly protein PilM